MDNRPGASGAIGTQLAANAAPDGYTLLLGGVTELVLNPQIVKVPYDPVRDFSVVSPLASGFYVLVVHPSLPAKSVAELIALAKSRPGEINYASGGNGSNLSLVAESGLRGMDVGMWFALLAPSATTRGIIARLNAEVVKLAAASEYSAQLKKKGFDPFTSSPEKFSAFMKAELGKWGR